VKNDDSTPIILIILIALAILVGILKQANVNQNRHIDRLMGETNELIRETDEQNERINHKLQETCLTDDVCVAEAGGEP
jgi:hypothetical protein